MVVPAPPANALVRESVAITGAGLLTVKLLAADVPPPGVGLVTVTPNIPAAAISGAVINAVTCVAFTNIVVRAFPWKSTVAPLTNPVPLTVSVNPAPPAVVLFGESVVIVGIGLVTAKFIVFDVPPPGAGLVTVTGNVPTTAMSAAAIDAVICVALTKVVVLGFPLKFTTDADTT